MRVSLATTVLPGLDHIGPLERAQTDVTVVRRAADLAELIAAARSGLVDAVLVAGGAELLGQGLLDELARAPRPVGVLAISEVAAERRRIRALGVPCLRADVEPRELARAVQEAARAAVEGRPAVADPEPEEGEDEALDAVPWEFAVATPDAVAGLRGDRPDDVHGAGDGPAVRRGDEDTRRLAAGEADGDPSVPDAGETPEAQAAPVDDAPLPDAGPADPPAGPEPGEEGRIVVVWGPTGAPGRTTVAVNLAAETAAAGLSTLLVDLDTYGPSVGVHLGLTEETAGVARAARRADRGRLTRQDLVDAAVRLRVAGGELDVLTGLTRPERWPEVRASAVEHILRVARQGWDRVVVDVGFCLEEDEELSFDVPAPQRNAATVSALAAADRVLAVGGADAVGLPRLLRGLEALTGLVDGDRVEAVVNRVRPAAAGTSPAAQVDAVWERYGPAVPLVARLPWDPQAADRALLGGQVLAEASPSGPLRRAVAALAERDVAVAAARQARGGRRRGRASDATAATGPRRRLMAWPTRSPRTR